MSEKHEMANEVTKSVFGSKAPMLNPTALAEAMTQSQATGTQRADGDYMNFSGKRGVYEIGKDKRDADPDEVWLVNVASFEDGYICWKGGQPVATRLYPMGTPVPSLDRNEHGPFTKDGDGWFDAKAFALRSVDTGDQAYFKINSVSGVSEFGDLQRAILAKIRGGEAYWPLIKLSKESFTAKGYKNYKPILETVGWLSDEAVGQLAETFEDEEAEVDLEELIAMSGGDPVLLSKPEPEPEPVKETVSRRRRI